MRHIGLGNQQNVRRNNVQYFPKKLNQLMGLPQMNTCGSDFLPKICNGIKTDGGCPLFHITKKSFYHLFKHMQALVIQIDLIGTERRPNVHDLIGHFFKWG